MSFLKKFWYSKKRAKWLPLPVIIFLVLLNTILIMRGDKTGVSVGNIIIIFSVFTVIVYIFLILPITISWKVFGEKLYQKKQINYMFPSIIDDAIEIADEIVCCISQISDEQIPELNEQTIHSVENTHKTILDVIHKYSYETNSKTQKKCLKKYEHLRNQDKNIQSFLNCVYHIYPKFSNPDYILKKIDILEGLEFEEVTGKILQANGFSNVEVTKASGDQGIDVIAFKDDIKYAIQCKCYSQPVGNSAVQEAYAGKQFYDCDIAVVLTNNYFTDSAIKLAQKNKVKLWGRNELKTMVEKCIENNVVIL